MAVKHPKIKTKKEYKRLQRCGICDPCLITEDCGKCNNCIKKATGKQACKLRKCLLILQIQKSRKHPVPKLKLVKKSKKKVSLIF